MTTTKKINPITNGEMIFPNKVPNLNQILFNGVNIFELKKPKIKKINETNRDQYLKFSPTDAFNCFMGTEINMVVISNYLLYKKQ